MNRRLNVSFRLVMLGLLIGHCFAISAGEIVGKVLSSNGEPTSGALVLVTDAATGLPLNGDGTTVPVLRGNSQYPLSVQTAADGTFKFDLPDGRNYNLFAQSWGGTLLSMEKSSLPISIPHYSDTVMLQGRAAGVAVPSKEATSITLSAKGSGAVRLEFESGNNDALAVVSTAPPALDPVFGFAGWLGDFMVNAVAMNRVPLGKTEFRNVPAGRIYIAVFGNDNKPGFGVAEVEIVDGQTTTVPMKLVADWSNGLKTPPPALTALYQKFEKEKWTDADIEGLPKMTRQDMFRNPARLHKLLVEQNPSVTLPDNTRVPMMDVLAVLLYLDLNS